MRSSLFLAALVVVGGLAALSQSTSGTGRDAAAPVFRDWIDARAGTGTPVHWLAEGAVYAYPSGKKLFGMIGFDSSRVEWNDPTGRSAVQLTRKTFTYTDPITGEVLSDYNGKEVVPIAYPYQLITYRDTPEGILADVEQGVLPRIQKIAGSHPMRVHRFSGGATAYSAAVFLDFPIGNERRYQAWENYDFFIQPNKSAGQAYQMSWQRYGLAPAWAGGEPAIYHLISWRVDSVDEFPAKLRAWAEAEKPNWLSPPQDLDEIRALQQGATPVGWGQ